MGAVGPPHISELLGSTTARALWDSGVTGTKLYPCHLTAPVTGDSADHRYCCGWQDLNVNHGTGPAC